MNILIVNDDGFGQPGIEILALWATKLGDVTVCAPKVEQSAKSHSINIHTPFEAKRLPWLSGIDCYSVDSTPADCVRFATTALNKKFDLVLSGINRGYNLGEDIAYSGTDAAIFEAAYARIPAVAFSTTPESYDHVLPMLDASWAFIEQHRLFDYCGLYNVNMPPVSKGILVTRQGSPYYKDTFKEVEPDMYLAQGYSVYKGTAKLDEDLDAVMNGYIAITPVSVQRTDLKAYESIIKAL